MYNKLREEEASKKSCAGYIFFLTKSLGTVNLLWH